MRNNPFGRNSLDNRFDNFDKDFRTMKRTVGAAFVGAGIGFVAGATGGVFVGEALNDYAEVLKEAPKALQYAVDVGSALVCGFVGAGIGGTIAKIPGMYKFIKNF